MNPLRLAIGLSLALLLLAAAPASADVKGPCTWTVAGKDASLLDASTGDAIEVPRDGRVDAVIGAQQDFASYTMRAHYGPFHFDFADEKAADGETPDGASYLETGDLSWIGRGAYRLSFDARLADGTTCSGEVVVDVDGAPIGSLVGIGALLLALLGVAGIIVGFVQNSHPRKATVKPQVSPRTEGPGSR